MSKRLRNGLLKIVDDLRNPVVRQEIDGWYDFDKNGNIVRACALGQLTLHSCIRDGRFAPFIKGDVEFNRWDEREILSDYDLEFIADMKLVTNDEFEATVCDAIIYLNDVENLQLGDIADWLEGNLESIVEQFEIHEQDRQQNFNKGG